MFGNFLYLIVVLLIYATYQPGEKPNFPPLESLTLFVTLIALFAGFTWLQFRRLQQRGFSESFVRLDHRFTASIHRHTVLAIGLFTADIYGLGLTHYTSRIGLLKAIPTLEGALYMALFVGYLAIVYSSAYGAYRQFYGTDISPKNYVASNIAISIPILIPWVILSGCVDIIQILPFQWPRLILNSPEGQVTSFLLFLIVVAILAPALIRRIWRCTPLEQGYYRSRIEAVCQRAGLQVAEIMYWPIFGGRMVTAGVMGLVRRFRYILVTKALLRMLNPEELDSVIAHEIGHVKRKHLLLYMLFLFGVTVVFYTIEKWIPYALIYAAAFSPFADPSALLQPRVITIVIAGVAILTFIVYFRYIFGYFMRNFERQADIYAFEVFGTARPLVTTLEKIALTSGQPPEKPNWHHFSIRQRIDYLQRCEEDQVWIGRHERKMRRSIGGYLAALLLVGFLGYQLNLESTKTHFNQAFLTKILERELARTPENASLAGLLGDMYQGNHQYGPAINAYRHALSVQSREARILNNLAWLLATCEDPAFRDPVQALELAQEAAGLQPAAHVLDTLAEAYYVNGRYEEALETEQRALAVDAHNRAYYEKQIEKFDRAAGGVEGGS